MWIIVLYCCLTALWCAIVYCLELSTLNSWFFIPVPVVLWAIAIISRHAINEEVEKDVFNADFLNLGLVIFLPMLSWISHDYPGHKGRFTKMVILAITINIVSLYDVWVPPAYMSIYRHFRSGLETISLTLVIMAFLDYFMSRTEIELPDK